jgi:hypothetical protein
MSETGKQLPIAMTQTEAARALKHHRPHAPKLGKGSAWIRGNRVANGKRLYETEACQGPRESETMPKRMIQIHRR